MATIQYPTKDGIKYLGDGTVYLKADNTTVWTFCSGRGYTCVSYTTEDQRFSNDGALAYAFYGPFTGVISPGVTGTTNMWQVEFGYQKIVTSLVIS
jgi:hypothetical protein